jgi:hypothetical protein
MTKPRSPQKAAHALHHPRIVSVNSLMLLREFTRDQMDVERLKLTGNV